MYIAHVATHIIREEEEQQQQQLLLFERLSMSAGRSTVQEQARVYGGCDAE